MKEKRQSLAWSNLQTVLDSAGNAAQKGTQQFFTPHHKAETLSALLPDCRPCITDLQCGQGDLLSAARNKTTETLLGADIDPAGSVPAVHNYTFLPAPTAQLYPLLAEVGWRSDLFTLNPPFSLRWKPETLHQLSESTCAAVRDVWKQHARRPTIDSVLATFLIALDRCTFRGEGYLICSHAAALRLFTDSPLADHIWLWLDTTNFFPNTDPEMRVAILYFAAAKQEKTIRFSCESLTPAVLRKISRTELRTGPEVSASYYANDETAHLFQAAAQEWHRLQAPPSSDWNLWLAADGTIRRQLTPFQEASGTVPRDLVSELDKLQGQQPLALAVQKTTRLALLRAVHCPHWRVDPRLIAAVEQAVQDYNSVRAPFYPLNEVQRLGYLDEHDSILCRKALPGFIAGHRYTVTSRTVPIERRERRMNLAGEMDLVEVTGAELLIELTGETERHAFTFDTKNKNITTTSHSLQTLVEHFEIPAVPDIATLRPDDYQAHLAAIDHLEASFACS